MSVISVVSPLGIEPRAKEPESFILSIKLRAQIREGFFIPPFFMGQK